MQYPWYLLFGGLYHGCAIVNKLTFNNNLKFRLIIAECIAHGYLPNKKGMRIH